MVQSDLCSYSDAYIAVKGTIRVEVADKREKKWDFVLKNNAPFISCTSRINIVLIDNTDDSEVFMAMYNLIEYNKNHSKTPDSL